MVEDSFINVVVWIVFNRVVKMFFNWISFVLLNMELNVGFVCYNFLCLVVMVINLKCEIKDKYLIVF